jgi:hypothetical protein
LACVANPPHLQNNADPGCIGHRDLGLSADNPQIDSEGLAIDHSSRLTAMTAALADGRSAGDQHVPATASQSAK